jgi:hypothetical protein
MTRDAATYYRNQITVYTDNIRIADFKANVAIIYGAFTIGPVMGVADKLPPYYLYPPFCCPSPSCSFACSRACFRVIRAAAGAF